MRFAFLLLFSVVPAFAQDGAIRQFGPLSPAGVPGSVLIVDQAIPTEEMVKRFAALAGGEKSKLRLIANKQGDPQPVLKKFAEAQIPIFLVDPSKEKDFDLLQEATGVWAVAKPDGRFHRFPDAVTKLMEELRKRNLAVAGTGGALESLGQLPHCWASKGVLVLDTYRDPAYWLAKDTALLLQGRDISAVGDGILTIHIFKGAGKSSRDIELSGKKTLDYNEMLRICQDRSQTVPYPPKDPDIPEVKSGALVIVGGGGMPADIAKRFIELGGGEEGHFVCLPTSMPDPVNMQAEGNFLKRMGANNLVVLPGRELKDVEDPKNLEILKKATGLWFGGGRQWRFVDAYEGTKAYDLFHDVLKRGGVIGGSSAGATIQGDYLVRGAPAGPNIMMCEGYERAFRFLPGVAIDQHFSARRRYKDMSDLMTAYPQFLGIGIDEATAIVVQGTTAEIMGPGKVHFYDRRKPSEKDKPDFMAYGAGTKYDLKERKVIAQPQEKKGGKEPPKPEPAAIAKEIHKLQLERYEALTKQVDVMMTRLKHGGGQQTAILLYAMQDRAQLGGELFPAASAELKENYESYVKRTEEAYELCKKLVEQGTRAEQELEQAKTSMLDAKIARLKYLRSETPLTKEGTEPKIAPMPKAGESKTSREELRTLQLQTYASMCKQIELTSTRVIIGRAPRSCYILNTLRKRALLGCELFKPGDADWKKNLDDYVSDTDEIHSQMKVFEEAGTHSVDELYEAQAAMLDAKIMRLKYLDKAP